MSNLQLHRLSLGLFMWYLDPPKPETSPTSRVHINLNPINPNGSLHLIPPSPPTRGTVSQLSKAIAPLLLIPPTRTPTQHPTKGKCKHIVARGINPPHITSPCTLCNDPGHPTRLCLVFLYLCHHLHVPLITTPSTGA